MSNWAEYARPARGVIQYDLLLFVFAGIKFFRVAMIPKIYLYDQIALYLRTRARQRHWREVRNRNFNSTMENRF